MQSANYKQIILDLKKECEENRVTTEKMAWAFVHGEVLRTEQKVLIE